MKPSVVQTSATHAVRAFGTGGTPTIAIVNDATTALGYDLTKLVAAMQTALDRYFVPVWGTPARLQIFPNRKSIPKGAWPFVFLDHADVDNALGYHDLTKTGVPVTFVFVKTTIDDGGDVAVTASHELWEVLVDPAIQLWAENAEGTLWAYETADAVEETDFLVDDVRISNFVYPSFFESFRKPKSTRFDHLGLVDRPFKLLKGGYTLLRKGAKVNQIFGSKGKEQRFANEDRRLHRSEDRGVPMAKRLEKLVAQKAALKNAAAKKATSKTAAKSKTPKPKMGFVW